MASFMMRNIVLFVLSVCGAQDFPHHNQMEGDTALKNPNTAVPTERRIEEDFDEQVPRMDLLVTGGAGFIGTHTVVELLLAGHTVTVIDDCSNTAPPNYDGGFPPSLERVRQIVGADHADRLFFHLGDVTNRTDLLIAFGSGKDAVIHFAGLKAVGESKSKPLSYYRVNQGGTVNILEVMREVDCSKIVFSSSATVYQPAKTLTELPLDESRPTGQTTNPYARSKLHVEEILQDTVIANESISVVNLRYFNPVGAHPSGLIGEDPRGLPNNVMPFISQVAIGRIPKLNIFGKDYESPDGTGMRDYIHVVDLAKGHLAALKRLNKPGFEVYNLGTGTATTVLELVTAFKNASGVDVPYQFVDRRPGDVAWLWCSPIKAKVELGWTASRNIYDMCRDMWKFQSLNPEGYVSHSSNAEKKLDSEKAVSDSSEDEADGRSDSGLSSDTPISSPDASPLTSRKPTLFSKFVHLTDPRDQFIDQTGSSEILREL